MRLSALFQNIPHTLHGEDVEIHEIEYDSRKVEKGDLFACIVGYATDGHKFAQAAIEAGAAALLVERELPFSIPQVIVGDSRRAMAEAAAQYYGHPARKLRMVGVTGTNGKTTTTYMLKSIFEHAGYRTGLIGTITNLIDGKPIPTDRTTPESVDLQRILAQMVEAGVNVCLMEVSSHSLDQERVHGIRFDVGIFTNLTHDHLDYHKTFENYLAAKKKLFLQSDFAIANIDDHCAQQMLEGISCPSMTFGICENADTYAKNIDITPRGVSFDMYLPVSLEDIHTKSSMHVKLSIPGLFSVYNAMGTAAAAFALGISPQIIKGGLEEMISVSGRLEHLAVPGRNYSVLLDYAHAPDALENILKTVRSFTRGRLITLFGCGGNRDRAKRPVMGEIAGRYSDYCIITTDNPRDEAPMDIMRAIEEGMNRSGCDYAMIENRRDAIRFALQIGREDDTIVLAGKGHETYQEIRGVKHHFDEKEIVAELAAELPPLHSTEK